MNDILGILYLFWPVTIALFVICFIAGFILALSLGSFFTVSLLGLYYGALELKKRGFFEWLKKKRTIVGESLLANVRDTFVIRGELDSLPNKPVLFIAHPHGLFSMAPFLHWAAQVTTWPFERKVHVAIHSIFFKIPFVRELCEYFGAIEATDEEIHKCLQAGESVALLTGGVREIHETEPGKMKIVLKKRKGFARIAQELNVSIVPVLTFGENELFPPMQGFYTSTLQRYLYTLFHVSVPIPTFESLQNWFRLLKGPLDPKVETWIGHPITTQQKSVQEIRSDVLKGFEVLFERGKPDSFHEKLIIL